MFCHIGHGFGNLLSIIMHCLSGEKFFKVDSDDGLISDAIFKRKKKHCIVVMIQV